ncbi:MAG: hypothetical protein JRG96_08400 [Deltaproteobacteria bacterium]|nr:hypothetical protein [Deltaproteobacteria bacterium]MBW2418049.1 hypothetical protein [Deltaproteobacteria bacterium]
MMRLAKILVCVLGSALLLGLSGCAWSGGPGSTSSSRSGTYYGGGSVHYNSFPRAYGYDGPYYVGRPY